VGAISMVEVVVKEEQRDDTGGVGGSAPRPLGVQGDSSLTASAVGGNAPRPLGVQGDSSSTGRRRRPVVAEEICIGCGKCEYLCPARPVSAITVHGIETHRNG
jgi:NAD-dependent dihydropyrimidine dehydrogenase PreA subunit